MLTIEFPFPGMETCPSCGAPASRILSRMNNHEAHCSMNNMKTTSRGEAKKRQFFFASSPILNEKERRPDQFHRTGLRTQENPPREKDGSSRARGGPVNAVIYLPGVRRARIERAYPCR